MNQGDMDVVSTTLEDYDVLMNKLATRLKIVRHPDNSTTTEAAKLMIEDLITKKPIKDKEFLDTAGIQKVKFTLDDVPLPRYLTEKYASPVTKDTTTCEEAQVIVHASKSLKLLYLHDQRRLQDQVNSAVSSIQSLTANPKTDTKQMAVGR